VSLARERGGSVDVFCPGFPADCLETLEEIAMEGRQTFVEAGGKDYRYIPCMNDAPRWIAALTDLAGTHLQGWPTQAEAPETLRSSRQRAIDLGAAA